MNRDFEQNHYSRRAKSFYRKGHDKIIILKWIANSDKYCEKLNYFDLMESVLSPLRVKKSLSILLLNKWKI